MALVGLVMGEVGEIAGRAGWMVERVGEIIGSGSVKMGGDCMANSGDFSSSGENDKRGEVDSVDLLLSALLGRMAEAVLSEDFKLELLPLMVEVGAEVGGLESILGNFWPAGNLGLVLFAGGPLSGSDSFKGEVERG